MDNKRILIVEGEPVMAMDIKARLLKMHHIVIDCVYTGDEAINIADKLKPDLILMAVALKGTMDGTETARIIASEYNIPIIFLAAYNDIDTFNRAKLSLPYGYLTKPVETRDLQNAISLALYRNQMETKLEKSQQRYSAMLENASCGIIVHDRDGHISDINKKGAVILGDLRADAIGKDFMNYVLQDDREYARAQLLKLTIEKQVGPNPRHVIQPNGTVIDVEYSASCINIKGEELIIVILSDITQSNQLRSQSLLNDKLATVGILAAGIIHEINNPLNWIMTNLSVFKERVASLKSSDDTKKLLDEFNEMVDETINGAERIRTIVHDLKGFTRIDDDELVPVDINQIIATVINMVASELKNNARIETHLQQDIPSVLMSGGKLQQVFLNLIMNAIQSFTEKDPEKNLIKITTTSNENQMRIDVQDSGMGIEPENISKVFDPFYTTKPAGSGTGLGLLICYDIVHSLAGEISIQSTPGEGTTFSVLLPLHVKLKLSDKVEIPLIPEKNPKRLKVLLVDDEPFLLKSLKRILDPNYDVTAGLGGKIGLEMLEKNLGKFDVIISDLYMPDISGADLYRYIADKYPGLEDRIIFVTGSVFSKTQEDFFRSIKNPKLQKPFEQKELYEAISQIFQ